MIEVRQVAISKELERDLGHYVKDMMVSFADPARKGYVTNDVQIIDRFTHGDYLVFICNVDTSVAWSAA